MVNIPVIYRVLYIQTVVGNGISEPSTVFRTWERGIFYVALSHHLISVLSHRRLESSFQCCGKTWKQPEGYSPGQPPLLQNYVYIYIYKQNQQTNPIPLRKKVLELYVYIYIYIYIGFI